MSQMIERSAILGIPPSAAITVFACGGRNHDCRLLADIRDHAAKRVAPIGKLDGAADSESVCCRLLPARREAVTSSSVAEKPVGKGEKTLGMTGFSVKQCFQRMAALMLKDQQKGFLRRRGEQPIDKNSSVSMM